MEMRITAKKNPLMQQVRKLFSSRKERLESGLFVADGTKLLQEAVRFYPGLETVILSDGVEAEVPSHVRVVRVSQEVMASVSPMEAPQGAIFLCRLPEPRPPVLSAPVLLLDGIQDPGNLGTILRTADALHVPTVLLEGCADAYSHKVVRASMGAVLRNQPMLGTWEEVYAQLREKHIPLAVTALSDRAEDIRQADLANMAVVIGSEGQGVRAQIRACADRELIIPMTPDCESLNAAVAAAIVMWQMGQV